MHRRRGCPSSSQGGQSCGLVGRTGSGKSSLMLALFRLIDVTGGAVYLDGIDVCGIGLDALRCQLAIIPQDPVLFSGTIRYAGQWEGTGGGGGERGEFTPQVNCDLQCHNLSEAQYEASIFRY